MILPPWALGCPDVKRLCNFKACCGTETFYGSSASPSRCAMNGVIVSQSRFHARQAAAALLKMAKVASDPTVAGRLVEAAADLKEQIGELRRRSPLKRPDVQTEGQPD